MGNQNFTITIPDFWTASFVIMRMIFMDKSETGNQKLMITSPDIWTKQHAKPETNITTMTGLLGCTCPLSLATHLCGLCLD